VRADPSILKVGSIAAFGVALSYLASALTAVMMPSELQGRPDVTPHQFWMVLSQHPTAHLAFHWSWVAAGFFGLGAVPAISLIVWTSNRGAILWSGGAAFCGFAVLARSHLMEVAFDRRIIPHYQDAETPFQQAVQVVAGLALDVPDGFLTYGAIGVWVVTVSWLGLRHRLLPRPLCVLGFAAGLTSLAGVLGYTFLIRSLLVISVGVGGLVVVPAWYAWIAFVLREHAAQQGVQPTPSNRPD
jgi:hypothetical protein